ncbi:conserved hypothetical protein [Histoplasma capsulatum H143]|uniref:Uncharacterized protein n=1 Tax=Ajellomyces capsulatus (strain H143) TaxID=544712 RepID=C6HFZ6_AJECH|nr:conserved hypothetical protein [Histoplasma capsulatum H143]
MLRRKPTALAITTEDIIAFEEARLRQQQLKENNNNQQTFANSTGSSGVGGPFQSSSVTYDPNDELKPLPGDKARIPCELATGRKEPLRKVNEIGVVEVEAEAVARSMDVSNIFYPPSANEIRLLTLEIGIKHYVGWAWKKRRESFSFDHRRLGIALWQSQKSLLESLNQIFFAARAQNSLTIVSAPLGQIIASS